MLKPKQALQLIEINEHKYYLSQQAGYDVGIGAAVQDWVETQASRFASDFSAHASDVEKLCNSTCGNVINCRLQYCPLQPDIVHNVLGDYEVKQR